MRPKQLGLSLLVAAAFAFLAWWMLPTVEIAPTDPVLPSAPAAAPIEQDRPSPKRPPVPPKAPEPAAAPAPEPTPTAQPEEVEMVGEGSWAVPKRLHDNLGAMEPLNPSPARMAAAEEILGIELSPSMRQEWQDEYQRQFEDASLAVGEYKLGRLSLEEAEEIQQRAIDDYIGFARERLGLSDEQLQLIFRPPG